MLDRLTLRDTYLGHEGKYLVPRHLEGLRRVEAATLRAVADRLIFLWESDDVTVDTATAEQAAAWDEPFWSGLYSSIDDMEEFLSSLLSIVAQIEQEADAESVTAEAEALARKQGS
jgi:hypothetical protein